MGGLQKGCCPMVLRYFGARHCCRHYPLCRTTLVKEATALLALGAVATTATMITVIGTVAHATNAMAAATDALAAAAAAVAVPAAYTVHVWPSRGQLQHRKQAVVMGRQ